MVRRCLCVAIELTIPWTVVQLWQVDRGTSDAAGARNGEMGPFSSSLPPHATKLGLCVLQLSLHTQIQKERERT